MHLLYVCMNQSRKLGGFNDLLNPADCSLLRQNSSILSTKLLVHYLLLNYY